MQVPGHQGDYSLESTTPFGDITYGQNAARASQDRGVECILPEKVISDSVSIDAGRIRRYTAEFWTSSQRKGCSIHEISYRACFKPQLVSFFVERFSKPGDLVYDPFGGRGTTVIEAGLLGRRVAQNDINPLSYLLTRPRFFIPGMSEVKQRLEEIPREGQELPEGDLSMFYHPETEKEILALRSYLSSEQDSGREDPVNDWIRMVATNRLTGHSSGFFSVYTLPPNQAVSRAAQRRINIQRDQEPPYRDTHAIILKKTGSLTRSVTNGQKESLESSGSSGTFMTGYASKTPEIQNDSVQLTVTSPPFLNIVQYSKDNWLRCWFNHLDGETIGRNITMTHSLGEWTTMIRDVFQELYRITKPGGWVAFEVGEVRKRTIRLDEHVIPAGTSQGFECHGVLVNDQKFTKTSNIWGIGNNTGGTNTNRIVLFRKE